MSSTFKFENPWDRKRSGKDDLDEIIRKGQKRLMSFLKDNKGKGSGGGGEGPRPKGPDFGDFFNKFFDFLHSKLLLVITLVALVMWLSTGFYTVQPDEEGVVMRFGKYSRTSVPGLNYKLPYPIEAVTKLSVTRVNKEEIGFRSSGKRITTREQLLESTVSTESQILTTDENIVDINFEVQWIISDAMKYLFNVRDLKTEGTVKSVAESAMREVIGLTNISDVLAEERSRIEQDAKTLLQNILDYYGMGVKVQRVQLLRVEPPQEVIDAYRDVQNAKQDKEREVNRALAYRNDVVPRARGEAEKILQEAEGYKQQVIAQAQGEAQRFSSIYEQYRNAKDVTRKRMYIETMEQILDGMDKLIMDKGSSQSGVVPYLPLNEIANPKKAAKTNNAEVTQKQEVKNVVVQQ